MGRKDSEHDRLFETATARLGWGLRQLDRLVSESYRGAVEVERVKVRLGDTDAVETLVVLEGVDSAGTPVVGFHAGLPPSEAVAAALRRAAEGQIRWKVDDYKVQG